MSFTALVLTTCIPILPTQTHLVLLKQTFQMRHCRWKKSRGSQSSAVQVGSVTVYSPLWSSRTMTVSCRTTGQHRISTILQIKSLFKSTWNNVRKQPYFYSQPLALLHMILEIICKDLHGQFLLEHLKHEDGFEMLMSTLFISIRNKFSL